MRCGIEALLTGDLVPGLVIWQVNATVWPDSPLTESSKQCTIVLEVEMGLATCARTMETARTILRRVGIANTSLRYIDLGAKCPSVSVDEGAPGGLIGSLMEDCTLAFVFGRPRPGGAAVINAGSASLAVAAASKLTGSTRLR